MRIQTRLFLGTALLVLTLMAVQWWLHLRQLRAVEAELGAVAASVGKDILRSGSAILLPQLRAKTGDMVWVDGNESDPGEAGPQLRHDVRVMVIPEGEDEETAHLITQQWIRTSPDAKTEIGPDGIKVQADRIEMKVEKKELAPEAIEELEGDGGQVRYVLQVEAGDGDAERFLVIRPDGGDAKRIPIPVESAVRSFHTSMQRGAAVGGVLLIVGLVGAGVLATRVTRPLRFLAEGAEAVGRGELGYQVPVTAAGEVGELQRSFNAMSARLAELEGERDRWRQREHLAQLGDVSRGLAHTLRNPLNTLGLAVEELASGNRGHDELVTTARSQIRRIDQWLRSFLALGAEDAAEPATEDLADLARAVVFEAVQQGARVRIEGGEEAVPVTAVDSAVRAALANLLDNAAAVSPEGSEVEVTVGRDGDLGLVTIRDHGPGLPDEVRTRLFEPHVTTKVGGSGMGLFLARQLVVGMHGGVLEVEDHPEGGTIAVVKLPLNGTTGESDD